MFNLVWQDEVIDSFDSFEEASSMKLEYEMAYGSPVAIEEVEDDLYEDDGQPTMYEEYQDLYGGDDAFETCSYAEDW